MNELNTAISAAACNTRYNIHDESVDFTVPDAQFGDYATNVALKIQKNKRVRIHAKLPKIKTELEAQKPEWLKKYSCCWPGF